MVQHGDLAEHIKWLLKPENARLLGHWLRPNRFIEAWAGLGILFGARKITTSGKEEHRVKTTIEHSIYGRITHDDETGKVTVQRGDLAERITWLLKPKNDDFLGHGYYPNVYLSSRPFSASSFPISIRRSSHNRGQPRKSYSPARRREGVPRSAAARMGPLQRTARRRGWVITLGSKWSGF